MVIAVVYLLFTNVAGEGVGQNKDEDDFGTGFDADFAAYNLR